jgi:uncharacterized membrane protein YphA (DoxX/SURF4 family)
MNISNRFIDEELSGKMRLLAPTVVRVGLSLVFLWFGYQQLMDAEAWSGLIPSSILSISGMSAVTFVYLNGVFEIIFGLCLLIGFFTRISALLLALHLFGIMFTVGYNDVGVRDFGLFLATISVFLHGPDSFGVEKFLNKNHEN